MAIIALDLGTTGNRALVFDGSGQILSSAYQEFTQSFPNPGWVEHDPIEILNTTISVLKEATSTICIEDVIGIGITNQRETVVAWNTDTGQPIYPAIVWQCRRTTDICQKNQTHQHTIKEKTGLFCDPYFSASKIQWLLDHVPEARQLADQNALAIGTIDSWIIWNLSSEKAHLTDVSNASRTMLYNIHTHTYDQELLSIWNIPDHCLAEVKPSISSFGHLRSDLLGQQIPITGVIGDQQAALLTQCGHRKNTIKNTYGTGLFLVKNTGNQCIQSDQLISTIAWSVDQQLSYALEGSIFIGGSAIQWCRDGLKLLSNAKDSESMAKSLGSNEDVYFVPALSGLGCPYWDPNARGLIIGLTRGTTQEHIVRAALESLAYQTKDVVDQMTQTQPITELYADGGASSNHFLMQFQADILQCPVSIPTITETTAFGAASLVAHNHGLWSIDQISNLNPIVKTFEPLMSKEDRDILYSRWTDAVSRSKAWADTLFNHISE